MKKILIPMTISLMMIGCNNYVHSLDTKNPTQTPLTQVYAEVKEGGEGGNPEVKLMHDCLKVENRLYEQCLNKLFPKELNVLVSTKQGEPILLAGRASKTNKEQVNLKNIDVYLLYVNISNIKLPISSNIINTQTSVNDNSMLFFMLVKKIKQEIILKNKDGKVVLHYEVINK